MRPRDPNGLSPFEWVCFVIAFTWLIVGALAFAFK